MNSAGEGNPEDNWVLLQNHLFTGVSNLLALMQKEEE
jgi:hypothetical protein